MTGYVDRDAILDFLERASPPSGVGIVSVRMHADLCEVRVVDPGSPLTHTVGFFSADSEPEATVLATDLFRFRAAVDNSPTSVSIEVGVGVVARREMPAVASVPLIERPDGPSFTVEIASQVTTTEIGTVAVARSVVDAFERHDIERAALVPTGNVLYLSGTGASGLTIVAHGVLI